MMLKAGIDIGSTTAKTVILDKDNHPLYSDYRRHNAIIRQTIIDVFNDILNRHGDICFSLSITGSAGMGISERMEIPFIQEVVASSEVAQRFYPSVRTLLDIGGEDSKLIFFDGKGRSDIRMNGNCAGGTGAFIDQMASLLGVPCEELDSIARRWENIHPIASRCGVFAKTDVQILMSRGISSPDIIVSVFNAVAVQILNTLARGFESRPKILFSGGPLTFLPILRESVIKKMGISKGDVIIPPHPELFSAMGAALTPQLRPLEISVRELLNLMEKNNPDSLLLSNREPPLFAHRHEFETWKKDCAVKIEKVDINGLDQQDCFIGVDSGSTTTKMVLIDSQGRIALDYYAYNKGNHISAVQKGLDYFLDRLKKSNVNPIIRGTAATGYGEDYIKTVFGLDMGVVETLAHYRAARHITDDVSFILDIGGQDMKSMFIENGDISKIEINEACSSGCGTFIQTFAEILECSVEEFSEKACDSSSPCDLGSRCTVFMNSKVKQFLREGAETQDMAAGLAYSVIRNCLNKVLKIKDLSKLGNKVVVQGGTFLNPSIQRAFEKLTGKKVYRPDIAGLMGAYGCALTVRDEQYANNLPSRSLRDFETLGNVGRHTKKLLNCKGCSNQCLVTRLSFDNGKIFYSGNRCESVFSNGGERLRKGFNAAAYKSNLIFDREYTKNKHPRLKIGIPRALNMFENFPFWCTLFIELGFEIEVSSPSSAELFEKGAGTVMSDSICFPAKLVHGHIMDLFDKGVDRIFYPMVVFERSEQHGFNSYNCPIVTGYPEVIKNAINPQMKKHIPLDSPTISFKDLSLLKKSCFNYLRQFGIKRRQFQMAMDKALRAHNEFKQSIREKGRETVNAAKKEDRKVILVVGRPYHIDGFINKGLHEMLSHMGVDVLTDDCATPSNNLMDIQALTQWEYSNRLYAAGRYANEHANVEVIQINSFGCGLDAIATDILSDILRESGKHLTFIRVDEIANPGSIKLRLRTLVESMKSSNQPVKKDRFKRRSLPLFMDEDRNRRILVPFFSNIYSPFVESTFLDAGYNFEVLPPPDKNSLEAGLKYANNEICFPAIIVVGDIIRALNTGKYNPSEVAVGITQTGAQCRASNYVTLIKRGLLDAGYSIPVVTVHLKSSALHDQPGFKLGRMEMIRKGMTSLTYADALSLMYHSILVREKIKGSAQQTIRKHIELWRGDNDRSEEKLIHCLKEAVDDFNRIPVFDNEYPKIGIVGEIYAKYNEFCNHNVVEWLTENGVEADVPCLINFFTQGLVNYRVDIQKFLDKKSLLSPLVSYFDVKVRRFLERIDSVFEHYRYYRPLPQINDIAEKASRVIDLTNQFGEGWLIAGEIIKMVEHGIENILCLQPFGCIANQVIAKGIEKGLKDLYPNLNILFVDLDPNTSEANMFNRLHFLVKSAKVSLELNSKDRKACAV